MSDERNPKNKGTGGEEGVLCQYMNVSWILLLKLGCSNSSNTKGYSLSSCTPVVGFILYFLMYHLYNHFFHLHSFDEVQEYHGLCFMIVFSLALVAPVVYAHFMDGVWSCSQLFTKSLIDEAHFHLDGFNNQQNCRISDFTKDSSKSNVSKICHYLVCIVAWKNNWIVFLWRWRR